MPKKSRHDLIRAAVGYYLKNKNYVGNRKSDVVLLQNRREFMMDTMQTGDLERTNSFTYSNHTITNGAAIVEHFGRFSQFVESQPEEVQLELRRFYAPLICHLYIDLLKAREQKSATEFLKKFAHLVAPVEGSDGGAASDLSNGCTPTNELGGGDSTGSTQIRFIQEELETDSEQIYFMNLLQTLSSCTSIEEVESDTELAQFRASKYELHTNARTANLLKTYLESRGHVLIVNLLHSWIQVHVFEHEQAKWTDDSIYFGPALDDEIEHDSGNTSKPAVKIKSEPYSKSTSKKHSSSSTTTTTTPAVEVKTEQQDTSDNEDIKKWAGSPDLMHLEAMRTAGEQFTKSQPLFPRCIKLADKEWGLSSADLDSGECHMAAGFNNSVIQLWQLSQHTCSGKNLYQRRQDSNCPWELNNCIREHEDQIEADIRAHDNIKEEKEKRKFFERKYVDNSYNEFGGIKLRGHRLGVTAVRFSAHYPLLYSVSKDSTMRSWCAESYHCALIYRGHRYPIWCFDESPLGNYVATGSKDLTARLWSIEREFPCITYTGHTQDVECITFHPNGNYIATGSSDLSVRLFSTTTGKAMRVFSDCKQAVTSVAFSPDGKLLAAGGEESKVRIFDLAAGAQMSELKDHSSSVTTIAWSSNGRQLATGCRDGTFRVWDTKRMVATHDSSSSSNVSSSSSSTSSSPKSLMALNSNCQRLVKVCFGKNDTLCCIGC